MKLSQLLLAAKLDCRVVGPNDPDIKKISTDSRRVGADELFVCIRGLKSDSHQYIGDAACRGATAVIADDESYRAPDGVTIVYTHDSRAALSRLWNAWYNDPSKDLRLIAVTGTNGKTTVTYMLDAIFSAAGKKCGIIGTVACRTPKKQLFLGNDSATANMTTPDPEQLYAALAEMRDDGAEYVFMETTSHAFALRKLDPLRYYSAIFTNLTQDHLDFHGTMENYFLAKATLLGRTREVLINVDDPWGNHFIAHARAKGLTCRCLTATMSGRRADYHASDIRESGEGGVSFTLRHGKSRHRVRCPIPGAFTVMNSLEAAACAAECGIGWETIAAGLSGFTGAPGRLEKVALPEAYPATVFIDYAHSPDALENILNTARGFTPEGKKLWVVFGCGGDRDRTKRPIMGEIGTRLADVAVITSDNSRSERPEDIISDILPGVHPESRYTVIIDRREAIGAAVANAGAGDVVILAGKGHEHYEINATGRHPFDEAAVVLAAAKKRLGLEER